MSFIDLVEKIKAIQPLLPERTLTDPLASLTEECGELATEILINVGKKNRSPGTDGIVGEAVDAILCLMDIILLTNPNITRDELYSISMTKLQKWENNYTRKS